MTKKEIIEFLKNVPDDAVLQSYGEVLQGIVYSFGENLVAACENHGSFTPGQKTAIIIPTNNCEQCHTWFDEFAPGDAYKIKRVEIF